jgi:hypothetical protein
LESKKGFRLLHLADFHLGSNASIMIPHRLLDFPTGGLTRTRQPSDASTSSNAASVSATAAMASAPPLGSRFDKVSNNKSALFVGTVEGGLGMLLPVDERTHRRLALLQSIMTTTVTMVCALNPTEFRTLKSSGLRLERKRGVLDGNILWNFVNLPECLQDELATAMGTSADVILENLQDLDLLASFF